MDKTLYRRRQQYFDRWSAFGEESGILSLSDKLSAGELREFEVFGGFSDKFLEGISPDVAVAVWQPGAVLFEEGSYVDLAFYVVEGQVAVSVEKSGGQTAQPIFSPNRTMAAGAPASTRQPAPPHPGSTLFYQQTERSRRRERLTFLSTLDFDLIDGEAVPLGPGELFGEIGALNGWPMSVTATTLTETRLVQIRIPALRRMKMASAPFKEKIDRLYRERALHRQLCSSPLFRPCSEEFVAQLAERVELVTCEPGEVLVEEGEPAESVYLVRSGFMKLFRKAGGAQRVASYLSKGMTFGEAELLLDEVPDWTASMSSVGYSELVRISHDDFRHTLRLFPTLEQPLWEQAIARLKESGTSLASLRQSEFLEFSLDRGLVEGNSILVIDLERCTRCDECVRACADTHGGRPRFVREGEKYDHLLIARACYHCQDPVCLIGCPTGAIRRANVGDVVEIKEDICIGCGNCASNCPYDAIVTHFTGSDWPDDALPKTLRGQQRMVASKCDLCHGTGHGPACVHNCPQGCAFRVGSTEEFQALLERGG